MASFKDQLEKIKKRAANMRERANEITGQVMQTVEVNGTSFVFGYLRGRMGDEQGELNIAGVPVGLGSGIILHLLGFAVMSGKYEEHVHNVADGAIAEYAAVLGMRMGAESSESFAGQRRIAGQSNGGYRNLGGSAAHRQWRPQYNMAWMHR